MRRLTPAFLTVLALVLGTLATVLPAPAAHAASDVVKRLDAAFAIQPDGTVRVRYELDWHFAEKGAHGITFGIATREPWGADRTKDAVYGVSDVTVTSPTGAPTAVQQTRAGSGSYESLKLRIGDPNVALKTRDATYVISYTLTGALRTFDAGPEFHWDVTSYDFPDIERFAVTVTAPQGVTRTKCLAGASTCASSVTVGTASYTGTKPNGVLTVVAGLVPQAVAAASPSLEPQGVTDRLLTGYDAQVTLGPDGVATVDETLAYRFPAGTTLHAVTLWLPQRLPYDAARDQAYTVENLRATDDTGRQLTIQPDYGRSARESSRQRNGVRISLSHPTVPLPERRTLRLQYTVRGAVVVDGADAALQLPAVGEDAAAAADFTGRTRWTLPVPISSVARVSRFARARDEERPFLSTPVVEGAVAVTDAKASDLDITVLHFPAASLTAAQPGLLPSVDATVERNLATGRIGGVLLAILLGLGGFAARVFGRPRDRRFAQLPPGVVGGPSDADRPVRPGEQAPVRFSPPELPLHGAGLLLDRGYQPRHLAAELVRLAVEGSIALGSKPVHVRVHRDVDPGDELGRLLVALLGSGWVQPSDQQLKNMGDAVDEAEEALERERHLVTRADRDRRERVRLWMRGVLFVLAIAAVAAAWLLLGGPEAAYPMLLGAAFGVVAMVSLSTPGRARVHTATGTALLDQVQGFRTYLATAEAGQLDFEADRDLYRRYLPWAVLFDLTKRWTDVCRAWADAGRIDAPDTGFLLGTDSADDLVDAVTSFTTDVAHRSDSGSGSGSGSSGWSSSGDSGSSSGFSSDSGGSGGGGTSASSW